MKRILPILLLLSIVTFSAKAQDSRTPDPETTGKFVKLYPNPATSYIVFDLQKTNQGKQINIVVYNFLGKKMYENQNVPEKTTVSLSEFARGVYIYHLTDQTGKVLDTGKFQVAR